MKPKLAILIVFLISFSTFGQNNFRVVFYNVENLFDIVDNPDKEDEEFTSEGSRRWTNYRYYKKINNLAKVISAIGEWENPALVGLCEVENDKVMTDLVRYSPLRKMQYNYVITSSEDARGINVALMYQRNQFRLLEHNAISIFLPHAPQKKTRDVLHVSGEIITGDTLDVFVCHFPSRRGGELASEPDRITAASIVRAKADSLMTIRSKANILIMGDFNDEPSNKSLLQVLNAKAISDEIKSNELYNLFFFLEKHSPIGSYKFREQWNFLDQIIVSGNLLDTTQRFQVLPKTATIFQAPFLLVPDMTHRGKRPKKTFHGYKYEGGYSDHLPVFVDFISLPHQTQIYSW
jgi:predicted extracellular nuclease